MAVTEPPVAEPPAAPPAPAPLTGQRIKRTEDPRMLVGAARYVADVELPHVCEAAFVRSTEAHARIVSIDVAEALAAPGVLAVLTARELADVNPIADMLELDGSIKTPRPPLPADRVRYVGAPVVAVIAEDRYLAEDAAELVDVEYEPLPPVTSVAQATADGPALFEHVPENAYFRGTHATAGTDEAFANAKHVVRRRLHVNRHVASSLEGRGTIARFDAPTGELTVWLSSQAPFQQRYVLSGALGLPESRIHVIVPDVGGAFGPKDWIFPEDLCVVRAAMLLQRPVRWAEDRVENLTGCSHAKEQEVEAELALDADGRMLALRGRFASDSGAFSYSAPGGLIDSMFSAQSLPGPYAVADCDYEVLGVLTNKTPVAPYRGVGYTAAQTLRELLLDDAARELGIDRVELRRRNLLNPAPSTSATGQQFDGGSYEASLDQALLAIDWAGFAERQAAARAEGRYLGIGVSPFVELTSLGTRSARQSGIDMPSHDTAWAALDLSGCVDVGVPTCSHGQGHATAFAQVAADALGLPIEQIRIVERDTERAPWGMGTYSSRSAVFGGGATLKAATALRERILRVASLLLEAPVEALELAGGFAGIAGVPEARIPLAGIAGAAHFDPGVREALGESGMRVHVFHDSDPAASNGCVAVELEVDPELCQVRLRRAVVSEDCGRILNPLLVDGQVKGGMAQAVGAALLEDFVYDEQGQPLTTTFMDYLLPRSSELVETEVHHLETPSPRTLGGMKGMAEGSSIGAPAAIVNAVVDALSPLGFHDVRLPLSPQAIWDGLQTAARGGAS